jgi:hypothetical protein
MMAASSHTPLALLQLLLYLGRLPFDSSNGGCQLLGLPGLVCSRTSLNVCTAQSLLQLGIIFFQVLLKAL